MHQMTVPVIMSTICRSLSNKINYLYALLCSNICRNTSVITPQETWLHDSYDDNLILLNGFNICTDKTEEVQGRSEVVVLLLLSILSGLLPTTSVLNSQRIILTV
uniref:Uncharacterized protein n=1 Tax=Trichobilharzia regenti TaxID=157069 RepID=A0AA85JMR7_TRIRE|nr:unnamed protein product [Trichobilharzia regenti]